MEYLSVTQFSKLYNLDSGNVRRYIAQGRINAIKIGNQWAIPANEKPPKDNRIKSGKYQKDKKENNENNNNRVKAD